MSRSAPACAASTTGFRDGCRWSPAPRSGDSRYAVCIWRSASSPRSISRTVTGQGQEGHRGDAGRRLESGARQAARPAAARPWSFEGIQPVRRRHCLRRRGAARRPMIPAAASPAASSNARAGRPIRTPTSISSPGAGLGKDLRRDRRTRLEDARRLCQAACPAVAAERDLRPHRAVDHDQDQVRGDGDLNKDDIPCGPILSMKELAEDQSLRATGHRGRGRSSDPRQYLSVGNPIKLSDSPSDVRRSPLLGEHTDENPAPGARLQRPPDRGDPRFRRARPAAKQAAE